MSAISRLSELTEDWKYFTERSGLISSIAVIATDLARLPYRHLRFFILGRSLSEPFPDWQPKTGLVISPFEPAHLDQVRQIDRPSEARLCAHRLAQGHKGLAAASNGRLAGYAWVSTDPHTRLERVHPKLDPGDALFTDSYTAPEFRSQGIQTALTLARFHLARELGYHRAICCIEIRNQPSLAVWQRKFNSQTIGTIDFTRIGPWYRIQYGR